MSHHLERMKAIVAQAIAEAQRDNMDIRLATAHLVVYGNLTPEQARGLFAEASRDTAAEGMSVATERAGSRYICWNCCGLRFAGDDDTCPNCGQTAMELPEEIDFALRKVEATTPGPRLDNTAMTNTEGRA
jgi:Zn finger protein HypA/HybF involved in hydrogenase expression